MNINVNMKVAGRYKLLVLKDNKVVKDSGWFNNLITNTGMDAIATTASGYMNNTLYCHAGTGNVAPANTDTTLVSELGNTNSKILSASASGAPDHYNSAIATFTFNVGAIVGNVAEIGISKNGTTLTSRALVLDGVGSPTTISVAADEQLKAVYEFRVYPPLTDATGTITNLDDSATYDYTLRACGVDSTSLWDPRGGFQDAGYTSPLQPMDSTFALGAITDSLFNGDAANSNAGSWDAYTSGTYQRTRRWSFTSSQGNASGGIGGIITSLGGPSRWQMVFTPALPKDSLKALNDFNMTISWSRAVI